MNCKNWSTYITIIVHFFRSKKGLTLGILLEQCQSAIHVNDHYLRNREKKQPCGSDGNTTSTQIQNGSLSLRTCADEYNPDSNYQDNCNVITTPTGSHTIEQKPAIIHSYHTCYLINIKWVIWKLRIFQLILPLKFLWWIRNFIRHHAPSIVYLEMKDENHTAQKPTNVGNRKSLSFMKL
ncbi:hypothetical protein BDC45DRAFT_531144 [Circinella umbellata]|nr:hypothetical protein BDC45DRAFT_531144 [Circinella umbellata]